jgi:hypothetical protein
MKWAEPLHSGQEGTEHDRAHLMGRYCYPGRAEKPRLTGQVASCSSLWLVPAQAPCSPYLFYQLSNSVDSLRFLLSKFMAHKALPLYLLNSTQASPYGCLPFLLSIPFVLLKC